MLTDQELLALYDAEMRIDPPLDGGQMRKAPGLVVFDAGPNSPRGGWVLYTHLAEDIVDAAIQSQIRHFRATDRSFEWKVFDHDTPANLKERLLAHGFTPEEPEALAVLDLESAPDVLWQPVPEAVRRVTQPDEIDWIVEILESVWDEPRGRLGEALKSDLIHSPHTISLFLAYVDDQPASAAWIYFHPGKQFADLFGGSTLEQYRGRGLYTALGAARAQEARGRGVRFLTVDASPMSRPILEKLEFRVLLYSQPFIWQP
jgi:hypothetical protein